MQCARLQNKEKKKKKQVKQHINRRNAAEMQQYAAERGIGQSETKVAYPVNVTRKYSR